MHGRLTKIVLLAVIPYNEISRKFIINTNKNVICLSIFIPSTYVVFTFSYIYRGGSNLPPNKKKRWHFVLFAYISSIEVINVFKIVMPRLIIKISWWILYCLQVNNAAVSFNEINENSVEHTETVIRTNFNGPKLLTEALLPMFRTSSMSRILNVSSRLGSLNVSTVPSSKGSSLIWCD